MRWKIEDVEKYEGAKEYFDTAIIPIYSFDPNELKVEVVAEQTWLEEVCVYAERQLTGRVLLLPTLFLFNNELRFEQLNFTSFVHHWFVTTNPDVAEKLKSIGFKCYLLSRHENEEDLALMVREGKKLAQFVTGNWKLS